jgi:hypothetical protein
MAPSLRRQVRTNSQQLRSISRDRFLPCSNLTGGAVVQATYPKPPLCESNRTTYSQYSIEAEFGPLYQRSA